jgi:hypothetical protein
MGLHSRIYHGNQGIEGANVEEYLEVEIYVVYLDSGRGPYIVNLICYCF